jgi:hypothetical protein
MTHFAVIIILNLASNKLPTVLLLMGMPDAVVVGL